MPEILSQQEMLSRAIKEVGTLYTGNWRKTPIQKWHEPWQRMADEFTPFSEKIIRLGRAVEVAQIARMALSEFGPPRSIVPNEVETRFSEVYSGFARDLLTDLLLSRVIDSVGSAIDIKSEANSIKAEVGINDKLSVDEIVEKVLTDKVKV